MSERRICPFYSHTKGNGNYLSNFYRAPYVIKTNELLEVYGTFLTEQSVKQFSETYGDEIKVEWSEQGFMLIKCIIFLEEDSRWNWQVLHRLLNAKSPQEAKECGRSIRGYDDQIWALLRKYAMYFNLLRKFNQNPNLKAMLLATGDDILVEASPYDKIWGVGLRESDPQINDPSKWKGLNLLGLCLEQVREAIR